MPSSVKQSNFAKKKKPKGQKVAAGVKKRMRPKARNAPRTAKQILALRYARQKAIAARKRMAGRSSSVRKASFSKRKK